tara:strand:- start:2461 stop:2823 length:363 start_codon:yes stop_codon:yes gene_type:complete
MELHENKQHRSHYERLGNIPFLVVSKTQAQISKQAAAIIGIDVGDTVLIASKDENKYIAVLPMDSTKKGYKVMVRPPEALYFVTEAYIKEGILEQCDYLIDIEDVLSHQGIDYFLLTKLT